MKSIVLALAAILAMSTSSYADTHVMWRTGTSGTLAVDPLAATAPSGGSGTVIPPVPLIIVIQSHSLSVTVGKSVSIPIRVLNAKGGVSYSLGGSLPNGLSLSAKGDGTAQILGVATAAGGTYIVDVTAKDSTGKVASVSVSITVS